MNYKELIELFRDENNCNVLDYIDDAADAIETLLAEQEAAVKYIPKVCSTCKYWDAGGCNAPITGGECSFDSRQAWTWCGPGPLTEKERRNNNETN